MTANVWLLLIPASPKIESYGVVFVVFMFFFALFETNLRQAAVFYLQHISIRMYVSTYYVCMFSCHIVI